MRSLSLSLLFLMSSLSSCDRDRGKNPEELLTEDTTLAIDLARANDALDDGDPDTSGLGLTDDDPPVTNAPASDDRPPAPTTFPDRPAAPPSPQNRAPLPGEARPVESRPVATRPVAAPSVEAVPRPAAVRLGPSSATCDSPAAPDQRACLLTLLAQYDVGLNATYRDVIQRMRREAGVVAGEPDPASVQELRSAQRTWLVYRDRECRRRTRSREGELWAPVRARCLGQLSTVRASVLRAM